MLYDIIDLSKKERQIKKATNERISGVKERLDNEMRDLC